MEDAAIGVCYSYKVILQQTQIEGLANVSENVNVSLACKVHVALPGLAFVPVYCCGDFKVTMKPF